MARRLDGAAKTFLHASAGPGPCSVHSWERDAVCVLEHTDVGRSAYVGGTKRSGSCGW